MRKIYSAWFYNNCVNIKLSEHSKPVKIFHVRDIENLKYTDNLEEFRNSSSKLLYIFYCCCYIVAVTVGSNHRVCSKGKGVLGDFVDIMGERQFWIGVSFQLSWRLDNLRLPSRVCEVFASAYFKKHRRTTASLLLWLHLIVFHAVI